MKKVFYLSTCSTCKRIIRELDLTNGFEFQDIKSNKITPEQVDEMKEMAGSYEALFSRRAMKFRMLNLHEEKLTDLDFREQLLKEYTFFKRPIIIYGDEIFVGDSRKNMMTLKNLIDFDNF
jgi:arsenate reductase